MMQQGWDDVMYQGNADIIMNGHFHVYHRYAA